MTNSPSRSPTVDATQIHVMVDRGVVTLTGTVRDYTTFLAAEEAARHTSAVLEVNNLTIEAKDLQDDGQTR